MWLFRIDWLFFVCCIITVDIFPDSSIGKNHYPAYPVFLYAGHYKVCQVIDVVFKNSKPMLVAHISFYKLQMAFFFLIDCTYPLFFFQMGLGMHQVLLRYVVIVSVYKEIVTDFFHNIQGQTKFAHGLKNLDPDKLYETQLAPFVFFNKRQQAISSPIVEVVIEASLLLFI